MGNSFIGSDTTKYDKNWSWPRQTADITIYNSYHYGPLLNAMPNSLDLATTASDIIRQKLTLYRTIAAICFAYLRE